MLIKVNLNKIQQANSMLSQEWKKQGQKLLLSANDFASFKEAVIWCGKTGHVSRTVKKDDLDEFAKHLWDNKDRIKNGEYSLKGDTGEFGGTRPLSWVSKILHIMYPKKYPIIYDNNIRKALGINNLSEYEEKLYQNREDFKDTKEDEEIFKYDSDLWASV